MVKDHSDSEKGNPLPVHRLLLSINSKVFFYMHHPTDRITHTTAFVTPVVEHWLEREIAQCVHPMKDRSDDPSHHQHDRYSVAYRNLTCLVNLSKCELIKVSVTFIGHTVGYCCVASLQAKELSIS